MKRISFTLLLLSAVSGASFAQLPSSATGNLKLHLMATAGFNNNGALPATWQDQSPAANDLVSGASASTEPTYVTNALSSGFDALQFNGTSTYMTRLAANVSGMSGTQASLFVVRIANTFDNTIDNPITPPSSHVPVTLSIGDNNSFNNEFGLMADWAIHCTSSGVWARKDHQCYYALPDDKPVITSAVLNTGTSNSDIDYYINGGVSTNTSVNQSFPSPFSAASRSIVVGSRYDGSATATLQTNTYFDGYILEVIAYDRLLTQTEIDSVHHYLKCKYAITYSGCNDPVACDDENPDCDDYCYWSVVGNMVNGARNIFGSKNDVDVRIRTNNLDRGIIKSGSVATGGFLGWNTAFPTARFHVNCANGNPDGSNSDIRFENLESGTGNIMAIDASGYVYDSGIPATGGGGGGGADWELGGNTITAGNNQFGTNSPDDVFLRTAGIDRGILTSGASGDPNDDGRLGWQTLNPTAHLHINCRGGNPEDGGAGSDVRFEELEPGQGQILVIDRDGYVYNSRVRLTPDGKIEPGADGKRMYDEQKAKVEELQKQVDALNAKLDALLNKTNTDVITPAGDASRLYQNAPNPFSRETTIEYYVYKMNESASVVVYDLNGKVMSRYPVAQQGKGSVMVNAEHLAAGTYMYSLIVDGREVDSKRMVLTK